MKKVATYVRVSDHSNSENAKRNQAQRLKDYCEQNGYEVCESAAVIGDGVTAYPTLMKLLQSAKDNGIETIVMASTNRIVGTVSEMEEVAKVFNESGVKLETMDGSHEMALEPMGLISSFLAAVSLETEENAEKNRELVFGYDLTEDGLVVNEDEAEVVKYIFARRLELATDSPVELIQEVIDDFAKYGEILPADVAKQKISEARINALIESEVKEKWPNEYESIIKKQQHNQMLMQKKMSTSIDQSTITSFGSEPIVSREVWEAAQAKLAESQDDDGQRSPVMKMT